MPDLGTAALVSAGLKTIGSVFSAKGASERADAIRSAAKKGKKRVKAFTDEFTAGSEKLLGAKQDILSDSGNVFDRIGGFIFGDTDSLNSLREAQSDFARLAAGDTQGFQREVEASVRGALAETYGAPVGAFENLSAQNLFNFRNLGLSNALTLTNTFAGLGGDLINTEFGILDRDFETRLQLEQNKVNQLNALDLQSAGVAGAGSFGIGSVFNTLGGGVNAYFQGVRGQADINENRQTAQTYRNYIDALTRQIGKVDTSVPSPGLDFPSVSPVQIPTYTNPILPDDQLAADVTGAGITNILLGRDRFGVPLRTSDYLTGDAGPFSIE